MTLRTCLVLSLLAVANAACSGVGTCSEAEAFDETPVVSLLQSDMHVSKSSPIHLHDDKEAKKSSLSEKTHKKAHKKAHKKEVTHTANQGELTVVSFFEWGFVVCVLLTVAGLCAKSSGCFELPRYVAEFLGTFMLVFSVGCNVLVGDSTWGVTSIACTLMVLIYALGGVSGANFNPAVSVSLGFAGKLSWTDVASYVCVQFAAGISAGFSYVWILGKRMPLEPTDGHDWLQAGLAELLYTFMLTFVVLNVACSKMHSGKNEFYGLAIGFTVVAGGYGAGAISGGCFNPAIALGIASTGASADLGCCLSYIGFEFIGCAIAAALFGVCRPEEYEAGEPGAPTLRSKLTSEFIGTFMLVLTVGLNVLNQSKAGAFSIAASLMCMIFALGSVSGAHFNPAVTLAIMSSGRGGPSPAECLEYMAVQVLGGICAAFTYVFLMNGKSVPLAPHQGTGEAMFGEFLFTFLLSFVVLTVATVKAPLSEFFGLAIGACVIAGGYAIGNLSGGSLNPAVSAGLSFSDLLYNGGSGSYFFYYAAVELLGGMFAAATFSVTHRAEFTKEAEIA